MVLLFRKVFSKEFGINFTSSVLLDSKKIGFMCDCGVYIGCFLYKAMFCHYIDEVTVKDEDKNKFYNRFL